MSEGYIKLNASGSANYKSPVSTSSALPTSGNTIGDIRETLDTFTLYAWNGSSWQSIGGGSGGGSVTTVTATSPVVSSGGTAPNISLPQANGSQSGYLSSADWTTFSAAQPVFSSPFTLVDNVSTPTTIFSYSATSFQHGVFTYSLIRNNEVQTGRLLLANNSSFVSMENDYVNTNELGITLSASLSGGNVNIQYISSSTGFNAIFKYSGPNWI